MSALRHGEDTIFYDERSVDLSDGDTVFVLSEAIGDLTLPRVALQEVPNSAAFRTPLNVVIADHSNERKFVEQLVRPEHARLFTGWIKSTDRGFYAIEFAWRRGEHVKRGQFSPDFFVLAGSIVLVIEIKGDEEIRDPSQENRAKYAAAKRHFAILNEVQEDRGYHFNFLTPSDYDSYFSFIRDGNYRFVSALDAELDDEGQGASQGD